MTHHNLLTRMLYGMLAAIALQGLCISGFSLVDALEWSWIATVILLVGCLVWSALQWRQAAQEARAGILSAWSWPVPWIIVVLLLAQIAIYPPSMSDSLCYRLPRMFLALQDGGIGRFETPDPRMSSMPWGWEMMALPFASLNLLGWSRLINVAAWLAVYQMLHGWALKAPASVESGLPACNASRARWVALALSTAPVMLLQASSSATDLYAGGLLLAGVWMIRSFHTAPSPLPVMASLLALVLAANVKPQFLVLGLPWLLWWAAAPGAPWRTVSWWKLAALFPLYLMLSPLPLMAMNYHVEGSLLGGDVSGVLSPDAPAWRMMVAGLLQFASAQLQLPIFPGAEAFTSAIRAIPGFDSLAREIPTFTPGVLLIPIIDGASFGLLHFCLIAFGVIAAIKSGQRPERLWLAATLFGFLVAASQIVPYTMGRSFMGFIVLLLPAAAIGLASFSRRRMLNFSACISILGGLATLLLNPSAPLWPSHTVRKMAETRGLPSLDHKLDNYHSYQLRAMSGRHILDPVPSGEPIALFMRTFTPVANLWRPDWRAHRIEFVNHIPPQEFITGSHRWLIVGEKAVEFQPEAFQAYTILPGWEKAAEHEYLPNLRQGPEIWTLYRRIE